MAMVKEYFAHDYGARHDIKIVALRAELGVRGYGVYWLLVEELYCNGNALPLGVLGSLAKAYGCPADVVGRVVRDFGLFTVDEEAGVFSSGRIARSLDERTRMADSRKDAALRRWDGKPTRGRQGAMQSDAGAMQSDAGAMQSDAGAMQSDAGAMQSDAGAMQSDANINRKRNIHDDDVDDARAKGPGGGKTSAMTATATRTDEDIGFALRALLDNEAVLFQVTQKSGMTDRAAIEAYIPEFAGQLALEGKTVEAGWRLALHFAYWMAKKRDRQTKGNERANLQEQKADKMRRDVEQIRAFARGGIPPGGSRPHAARRDGDAPAVADG